MDRAGSAEAKHEPARTRAARNAAAISAGAIGLCLTAATLYAAGPIDGLKPRDVTSAAGDAEGRSPASTLHIGYGVNPYSPGDSGIGAMGYDWTKVWVGPWSREPYRVLRREDVQASTLAVWASWDGGRGWPGWIGDEARDRIDYIEAWEIGNEVNLGTNFGWNDSPDAAAYTHILCLAYEQIKAADPTAIIVSAGLAPVGRVPFTYNGHQGYCAPELEWCGGWYQDEREFLLEMLAAGAGDCFDALGYHPYGFAARYDAAPGSWECGVNDFCFRGVEAIRDIMVNEFGVNKPIWATEFGWIVNPVEVERDDCLGDSSLAGFNWMTVTLEVQAANLRGAYEYAEANYPWMGAMLLFNLGFAAHHGCTQMSFFDVEDLPAEAALTAMVKNTVPTQPVWSGRFVWMLEIGDDRQLSGNLTVRNLSPEPINWTGSLISSAFPITLSTTAGDYWDALPFTADSTGLPLGTHSATLALTVTTELAVPIVDAVQSPSIDIIVVEEIFRAYLPLIARRYQ